MKTEPQLVRVEGKVMEALPGLLFRVIVGKEGEGGHEVLGHLAGRLKLHRIRVIPGDRVVLEMASMNDTRGRIVRRL